MSIDRFVSVDPYAGDPMSPFSLHRYLYGDGSPLNGRDPNGQFTLTELVVTTTVIAILGSVVIPRFYRWANGEKYIFLMNYFYFAAQVIHL